MLDAAERIRSYLVGFDEDAFYEDLRTIDAVCMNLVRIGEGAGELSDAVKTSAPHLPWRRMTDMRNRIAHSYAGVKLSIVWRTARLNVPELAAFLRAHLGRGR
jgi:uncharacterized protein with HEPN domain